jgi:hypothetical protein
MAGAAEPASRRVSLAHLILGIPWVAVVIDAWAPIRDNSFLWHIRAGTAQQPAGSVLTTDPFSFTATGEPWRTQSWLAELLYAWGEGLSGLGFVPPMMLVASTIALVGIGLVAHKKSGSVVVTSLILFLSTVLLISFLVPRPVIFSFALFPLVILAWENPKARFALPFLFWVWASVHGSFIIGLGWVFLALVAEREWRRFPFLLVSGTATLLTAHGLGVLDVLIDFSRAGENLALLTEWRRPEPISAVFTPFLIGAGLLVVGGARRKIEPRHLLLIAPFLLLGFSSTRAVPPAWLGLLPMVALALQGMWLEIPRRFSMAAAGVFAIALLGLPFLVKGDGGLDDDRFPVEAAQHLDPVNTFHDDRAGGYLIYAKWPEMRVFLDDRAELYADLMAEFVAVRSGEADWRPLFEREGIDQVLLPADERLVETLLAAGWRRVYGDESFVVLR